MYMLGEDLGTKLGGFFTPGNFGRLSTVCKVGVIFWAGEKWAGARL